MSSLFLSRSEYDHGVNTFSPEGRLFQIEYALEAIKLGTTAVGVQTREGVVLAVEKRVMSALMEASSVEKVMEVDRHICAAMSGLTADAKTLVDHARVEAQNYRFNYGEPLPVESCAQAICDVELRFGEGKKKQEGQMSRPYGVAMLVAGVDADAGPALYHTDPSGTFTRFLAKAIGAGSEGAQTTLQERYNRSMTLAEAEALALFVLKQVMEEKISSGNVEMAAVRTDTRAYEVYPVDRIERILASL